MDDKTRDRLNKMLALALSAGDGEALAALAGVKRILEAQGKRASDVRVDVGKGSLASNLGGFTDAHMLELLRLRTTNMSLNLERQKLFSEVAMLRRELAYLKQRPLASASAEPARGTPKEKRLYTQPAQGTIRWLAERLLLRDNPVLSYYDVLVGVQASFPGAKTSVQSLRWYETQMRQFGYDVPKKRK
jgi:hypothetical protein